MRRVVKTFPRREWKKNNGAPAFSNRWYQVLSCGHVRVMVKAKEIVFCGSCVAGTRPVSEWKPVAPAIHPRHLRHLLGAA